MTKEEARNYFESSNLNYQDIEMNDIYKLIKALNKHICVSNNEMLIMINEPILKGKHRNIIFKNNQLVFAQLTVKGTYFKEREAITFDFDGFIGFCGWADKYNEIPFIHGFLDWCNYMINKKLKMEDL